MEKKLLIPLSIIVILLIFVISFSMLWKEEYKTTNISNYNEYLGQNGKHSNDIFPQNIPESAEIEDFYYYYYNPFDPNYVSYLVYSCNDEDYTKEIKRLSKLHSSEDYLVYGATGFNYPICAVYADNKGYIYALTDKKDDKIIYVEIKFCNYFSDINYDNIINNDYLPINFNAKSGNPTREAYEKQ